MRWARRPRHVHGHPVFEQFPSAPGPREQRSGPGCCSLASCARKRARYPASTRWRPQDADVMLTVAGEFWGGSMILTD